jgi:hypothetical protein
VDTCLSAHIWCLEVDAGLSCAHTQVTVANTGLSYVLLTDQWQVLACPVPTPSDQ